MWSAQFDYCVHDVISLDVEDEEDDDDGYANCEIEAMLYSELYHSEFQGNDELNTVPVHGQKTSKSSCEVESICEAKVFCKIDGSANDFLSEDSMAAVNGELSRRPTDFALVTKRYKNVEKVLHKGNRIHSKLSSLNIDCVTAEDNEVEITIRNSKARSETQKSAVRSTSSSSSDEDGLSALKPSDISTIYTHFSEDVASTAGDSVQATRKSLRKCKSKSPVAKKLRLSCGSGDAVATDTREMVAMPKDVAELQAACFKAMTHFYTNTDASNSVNNFSKTSSFKKGRSSNWAILSSDRHGTRQTRGRFFMKCTLCMESGHLAESCPQARKQPRCRLCGDDHLMNSCDNRLCTVCWQPWHPFRHCPLLLDSQVSPVGCNLCNRYGHVAIQCSDHWRKFHSTVESNGAVVPSDLCPQLRSSAETFCYNCGRQGHFGHDCYCRRMNVHAVPYVPFVASQRDEDAGMASHSHRDFDEPSSFGQSRSNRNGSVKEAKAAKQEKRIEWKRARRQERKAKWMALSRLRRETDKKKEKQATKVSARKTKKTGNVAEVASRRHEDKLENGSLRKRKTKKSGEDEVKMELKRIRREQRKAKILASILS